jgi:hypothetical protein
MDRAALKAPAYCTLLESPEVWPRPADHSRMLHGIVSYAAWAGKTGHRHRGNGHMAIRSCVPHWRRSRGLCVRCPRSGQTPGSIGGCDEHCTLRTASRLTCGPRVAVARPPLLSNVAHAKYIPKGKTPSADTDSLEHHSGNGTALVR